MSKILGSEIPVGTKVGMSFNLGKVDHPIYGKADISGVIPLLLPNGKFPHPDIVADKAKLEKIVARHVPKFRDMWPDDLDEEVASRIRDFVRIAHYLDPTNHMEGPYLDFHITNTIVFFAIDDLVDNLSGLDSMKFSDMNRFESMLSNTIKGKYKSVEEMPCFAPALEPVTRIMFDFAQRSAELFPDKGVTDFAFSQVMDTFTGHILLHEEDNEFSASTNAFFRSYSSGGGATFEIVFENRDAEVPSGFRDNLLVQRLKYCIGNVTDLMNDVVGLGRDLRKDQVKDSYILSAVVNEGIELQTAFENTMREIGMVLNDIQVAVQKLRELYKEDAGVQDYLDTAVRFIDGQTYCYALVDRYGEIGLKVVKVDE